MGTPHRPTAHEPPHTPPLDRLKPIQPELPAGPDPTVPPTIDAPDPPAPGPEEEPI